MELTLVHRMLIALGLGLLIGLQREWADKEIAGIRTMPLVCLLGLLTYVVAARTSGWVLAGALVALALVVAFADFVKLKADHAYPGVTTEIAIFVGFVLGGVLAAGEVAAAVVAGGATAVLLHWKRPLHRLVERMGEDDLRSVIRLALLGLVILPVLPDRAFDPWGVLNPFEIWLMVVLIVGISLAAYVAYRLLGARRGFLLAGLLGGLISSTATTVTYARAARRGATGAPSASLVIVLASALVFLRVGIEITVVAPGSLAPLLPPLLAMTALVTLLCLASFVLDRPAEGDPEDRRAPSELQAAIVLGLLYALVLASLAVGGGALLLWLW